MTVLSSQFPAKKEVIRQRQISDLIWRERKLLLRFNDVLVALLQQRRQLHVVFVLDVQRLGSAVAVSGLPLHHVFGQVSGHELIALL